MGFKTPEQFFTEIIEKIGLLERRLMRMKQPGQMITYVGTKVDPPIGTVWADGALLEIATYPRLFDEMGPGAGDGITTFSVPNFNGRTPVGYDPTQPEFDEIGKTGGAKTHTLTAAELANHVHSFGADDQVGTQGGYTSIGSFEYDATSTNAGAGRHLTTSGVRQPGSPYAGTGNQPHNNLAPYGVVRFAIYY